MQQSQWFYQQIQASTQGFLWAIEQIPQERHFVLPRAERWSLARILYHMVQYDLLIGLPTLRQWRGESYALAGMSGDQKEDAAREEANWRNGEGQIVPEMIATFKDLRADQLVLLQQFQEPDWNEARTTLWGPVILKWFVVKTYQHTLEHTDEILRMYLWGR